MSQSVRETAVGLRKRQAALLLAVARGSEAALSDLYDGFERPLYSLGIRWLGDAGLAEELVQEVMIRIWRRASTFDGARGSASSWIFGVARNIATDLARARNRYPVPVHELPDGGRAWDDDAAWQGWQVAEALGTLPAEQQEVLELAFVNQLTHSEISRSLHVPLGTVKTRMYVGIRKLRTTMVDIGIIEEGSA